MGDLWQSLLDRVGNGINEGSKLLSAKIQKEIENLSSAPPASNVSTGFTVDNFIESIEHSDCQEPITVNESTKIYQGLAEKYKTIQISLQIC